ncbi:MAG: hypothetical protein IPO21_02000 [Bacteroidales bacterium]|nr:hypothetical protein [Bacteroidales bacterium]
MNTFCPISYNTVDRNTSRVSAGIVSLTAILFLLLHSQITLFIIVVLGIDFFIRGF